jgi:hypothetical protein
MQELLRWTLDTIREEEATFSWMEEYRYEWTPLVKSAVSQSIEGKTCLILTDEANEWFSTYILKSMNALQKNRPLLPFYSLRHAVPQLSAMNSSKEFQLLEDMLDISYPNGYYIWYIGKGSHPYSKISYRKDDSFLWVMDEEVQNAFALRSHDSLVDIKLLQLFKLFEKTLLATLFGELDLEQ